MTVFNLYVFSRAGDCLFYTEWFRPVNTLRDLPDEDRKLMYGLLFSLKQLMNKANPVPCGSARGERARAARSPA
jgi:hypothetical protein